MPPPQDGHIDNKIYDYDIDTIYQHLQEASRSWKVYFHDIPQSLALKRLQGEVFKDRFSFSRFPCRTRERGSCQLQFIEPVFRSCLQLRKRPLSLKALRARDWGMSWK